MKYYAPDEDKGLVKVFDEHGDYLKSIKYEKMGKLAKVGLICHFIASGDSLAKIATGKGWRPTEQIFFVWLAKHKILRKMYSRAKKTREEMLLEQLINAQNENKIEKVKILTETLKSFNKKIVRKILPAPVVVERSDWKHGYKSKWKMNIPQKQELDKGIDKLKERVEGGEVATRAPARVVTIDDLKDDLMAE